MKRCLSIVLIATLLLSMIACSKKNDDIPTPTEAPPQVEEKAETISEQPKPEVHVTEEPEEINQIDPSSLNLQDVYFDFDKFDLRSDSREALTRYAEVLKANGDVKVLIEGHCDERGTEEYNMGLGERRASRVRDYLVSLGIDSSRLKTISYGEMRPQNPGHNEEAWALNRRAHFKLSR
ncbi:peptidoglycan-associated lipoprotein Pal [Sulfidibacter corallicola]